MHHQHPFGYFVPMPNLFPIPLTSQFYFRALRGAVLAMLASAGAAGAATPMEVFFKEQCIRCHGEKKAKGDLRLDTLSPDMSKPENFDI